MRSLVIAGLVALGLLGGWEVFWRHRGFAPALTDNESLWCTTRGRVRGDALVIVGSSRVQSGLDPAQLSKGLGRPVVQLAIGGTNPLPVFYLLARDPEFHGVIVLDYMPRRLFTNDTPATARARGFLASCRDPSLVAPMEAWLGQKLQGTFVVMTPELQLMPILSYLQQHRALPAGNHELLREDRFDAIHFDLSRTDRLAEGTEVWEPASPPEVIERRLADLAAAVAQLRARGGDVVLYRAPVSGNRLAEEEARFPAATWLPRVERTLQVTAIDAAHVDELRTVSCPDGEHPDASMVPAITDSVTRELARLLPR